MTMNWKEMFTGLTGQANESDPYQLKTESPKKLSEFRTDDESLTEEVPYKLEPSLEAVEQYLNRIRRHGL